MNGCRVLVSAFLVLALVGGAVGGEADTFNQKAAFQRLQEVQPGVQAHWTGERVTRLYGRAIGQGITATEATDRFVADHVEVFGVSSADLVAGSTLQEDVYTQPVMYDHETGEYKFTLVYYSQHQDGIPVFRSELRVLVANQTDHPVVLAVSTLRDLGDFNAEATVSRGAATVQANTGMEIFSEAETVIWAGTEDGVAEPRLALTFTGKNTRTDQGYEAWRYVADASTGEILHRETLIHFVDVTGSIDAMATPGAKANICTEEILFPYPWARVDIQGGSSVYADGDGNFTIPNAGSSAVTVRSYVDGLYFAVENRAGSEETLSQSVTPPGPVDFTHNELNTDDLVLAQVNIYVSGNQCRDWILVQNPSFPGVVTETGVPTIVNRTDFYCPCNAWSDGSDGSINFCQPGGGCPNTAWQSVLNHEYGHHCIDFTGSGQGEYGEGMADCFSMLPVDDPNLGYGFSGNCNSGLRTADNDCQYLASGCSTCGSESHDCGQLLSGCVWSIRNELVVTEPVDYLEILSSIVINSILLHTGTSIDAQIPIDFLTLDDDDANIGNGTPHRAEICAGFADHGIDCPELVAGLGLSFPSGLPATLDPGLPTDITVRIQDGSEVYVPGTGTLHYRLDGGSYLTATVSPLGGDLYQATLPAADCSDSPEYYFSAEGDGGSTVYSPEDAPTSTHSARVGTLMVLVDDNFEGDAGWTVTGSPGDGDWTRGVPVDCDRGDPPSDSDGSGQCWLTDNSTQTDCNSDVDGGTTILTSLLYDLSDGGLITFDYWLDSGPGVIDDDSLTVEVATNAGSTNWALLRTYVDPQVAWRTDSLEVGAGLEVEASATIRLRFSASDLGNASLIECGLDALLVEVFDCSQGPTCSDDLLNQGEDRIDCGGPCPACECTSDGACDNTVFCDGAETCDAYGDCQTGSDPCAGTHWCKESADTCILYGDGDFEPDGDVDLLDFASFQVCYGQIADSSCEPGNLNGTGMIDLADYSDFATGLEGPD
ncbi:MAG: hypothetical protein GY842_17535 [bacterium]|nr:hypothetical protein [bacterium]